MENAKLPHDHLLLLRHGHLVPAGDLRPEQRAVRLPDQFRAAVRVLKGRRHADGDALLHPVRRRHAVIVLHFVQQQEDLLPLQRAPEDDAELVPADPVHPGAFRQAVPDILPAFDQHPVALFPAEILVDVVKLVAVDQRDGHHLAVRLRVGVHDPVQVRVKRVPRREPQRVVHRGHFPRLVFPAQFLVVLHRDRPFPLLLRHIRLLLSVIFCNIISEIISVTYYYHDHLQMSIPKIKRSGKFFRIFVPADILILFYSTARSRIPSSASRSGCPFPPWSPCCCGAGSGPGGPSCSPPPDPPRTFRCAP